MKHLRNGHKLRNARIDMFWEALATGTGLSEQSLRADRQRERKVRTGSTVGCSWAKCVMYQHDYDEQLFACSRCRNAMYCDLACQQR